MPFFVDSHAHLNMEEFHADRSQVIQRAFHGGVCTILCPAEITDFQNVQTTLAILKNNPNIIAAGGVHPHNAKDFSEVCLQKIEDLAGSGRIHAVGEIGLDFHYDFSPRANQILAFRKQLLTAHKLNLPVVIHSRNAGKAVAQVIEEEKFSLGGVLHCFTEEWEFARHMLDRNFFVSFSGILTFPRAQSLQETAKKIPLSRILIETDSPYLVPVPFRGKKKRNEPLFVKEIASFLSELRGIPTEKLCEATRKNFETIFKFEIKNIQC